MNHEEIIKSLREPFLFSAIEWKIQVTAQDKTRGMAVAYLDSRAVQRRLDEVVGAFNWKNVYSLWHDNSQICGISIFNAERGEWVTKFDGAENSDIEPIKGGLSDSFKRSASMWGIGRYLYEMDGIWVEIEPKGKSFAIKQNQYNKLESEYNAVVGRLFGSKPNHSATPPAKRQPSATTSNNTNAGQQTENTTCDFKVHSIKPSGKSSQILELVGGSGEKVTAYIKASDKTIAAGSRLRNVRMERKNSSYGEYNLITGYEAA
jgi:hypothetical protein